jgi:hypothetical protein
MGAGNIAHGLEARGAARSRTWARTREPTEIKVPERTPVDIRTERI